MLYFIPENYSPKTKLPTPIQGIYDAQEEFAGATLFYLHPTEEGQVGGRVSQSWLDRVGAYPVKEG